MTQPLPPETFYLDTCFSCKATKLYKYQTMKLWIHLVPYKFVHFNDFIEYYKKSTDMKDSYINDAHFSKMISKQSHTFSHFLDKKYQNGNFGIFYFKLPEKISITEEEVGLLG